MSIGVPSANKANAFPFEFEMSIRKAESPVIIRGLELDGVY